MRLEEIHIRTCVCKNGGRCDEMIICAKLVQTTLVWLTDLFHQVHIIIWPLSHTHIHTHTFTQINKHKYTQTIAMRKAKFYGCIYWTNSISTDWKLSRWWFLVFHIRCLAVYTRAKNWLGEVNYVGNRKPYLLFVVYIKVYTYIRSCYVEW